MEGWGLWRWETRRGFFGIDLELPDERGELVLLAPVVEELNLSDELELDPCVLELPPANLDDRSARDAVLWSKEVLMLISLANLDSNPPARLGVGEAHAHLGRAPEEGVCKLHRFQASHSEERLKAAPRQAGSVHCNTNSLPPKVVGKIEASTSSFDPPPLLGRNDLQPPPFSYPLTSRRQEGYSRPAVPRGLPTASSVWWERRRRGTAACVCSTHLLGPRLSRSHPHLLAPTPQVLGSHVRVDAFALPSSCRA